MRLMGRKKKDIEEFGVCYMPRASDGVLKTLVFPCKTNHIPRSMVMATAMAMAMAMVNTE